VVSDPDRWLPIRSGTLDDVLNAGGAIQHRELRVQMQMHERVPHVRVLPRSSTGRCG
jgi:hypothetical protein